LNKTNEDPPTGSLHLPLDMALNNAGQHTKLQELSNNWCHADKKSCSRENYCPVIPEVMFALRWKPNYFIQIRRQTLDSCLPL
jgi:hypothetical protein